MELNDDNTKYSNYTKEKDSFKTTAQGFFAYCSEKTKQEKNNIEYINLPKLLLINKIDSDSSTLEILQNNKYIEEKNTASKLIRSLPSNTINSDYSIDSDYILNNVSDIISSFIAKKNVIEWIKSNHTKNTPSYINSITLINNLINLFNNKNEFFNKDNSIKAETFNQYYRKNIIAIYNCIEKEEIKIYNCIKKEDEKYSTSFLMHIINQVIDILNTKGSNYVPCYLLTDNPKNLAQTNNPKDLTIFHTFYTRLLSNEKDCNIVVSYLTTLKHFFEYLSQENTVNIQNNNTKENEYEKSLIDLLFFIYCVKENSNHISIFLKNIEHLPLFIEIQKLTDENNNSKSNTLLIEKVCNFIKNNQESNIFIQKLKYACIKYAHENFQNNKHENFENNKKVINFIIKNILAKDKKEEEFLQKICYFNPNNTTELENLIKLEQYINISDINIILKKLYDNECFGQNYRDQITSIIAKKVNPTEQRNFFDICLKDTGIPEKNKITLIRLLGDNDRCSKFIKKAYDQYIYESIFKLILEDYKENTSRLELKDILLLIKKNYQCSNIEIFESILSYGTNLVENNLKNKIDKIRREYLGIIISDTELKVEKNKYNNTVIYDFINNSNKYKIGDIKKFIPEEVLLDSCFLYEILNDNEYEKISNNDTIDSLNIEINILNKEIENYNNIHKEDNIRLGDMISRERTLYKKKYILFKALFLKEMLSKKEYDDVRLDKFKDINNIFFLQKRHSALIQKILKVDNIDDTLKFFIEYFFKDYKYELLLAILNYCHEKDLIKKIIEDYLNNKSIDWKKQFGGLISFSRFNNITENINNITASIDKNRLTEYIEYMIKKITNRESLTIPELLFLFINHTHLSQENLDLLNDYLSKKSLDHLIEYDVYEALKKLLKEDNLIIIDHLKKYLLNKQNINDYKNDFTDDLLSDIVSKYPNLATDILSCIIKKECITDPNINISYELRSLLVVILKSNPKKETVKPLINHLLNKLTISNSTAYLLSAMVSQYPDFATKILSRIIEEKCITDNNEYIKPELCILLVKILESKPAENTVNTLCNNLINKKYKYTDDNSTINLISAMVSQYPDFATKILSRIIEKECGYDNNIDHGLYNLLVKILGLKPAKNTVKILYSLLLNKKNQTNQISNLLELIKSIHPESSSC